MFSHVSVLTELHIIIHFYSLYSGCFHDGVCSCMLICFASVNVESVCMHACTCVCVCCLCVCVCYLCQYFKALPCSYTIISHQVDGNHRFGIIIIIVVHAEHLKPRLHQDRTMSCIIDMLHVRDLGLLPFLRTSTGHLLLYFGMELLC